MAVLNRLGEFWGNPQFVHRGNQAANVVADDFRQHFVPHRGIRLAPHAVPKVIKELSDHAETKTHGRHLHIERCRKIGLVVEALEDDDVLQDAVLSVHHSMMQTFEVAALLICGTIFGALAYLATCGFRRKPPAPFAATESGLCGAGIGAGLHLSYAAIFPDYLVHLTNQHGAHIDKANLLMDVAGKIEPCQLCVGLGEFHLVHIILAGIATVIVAAGGLWKFCSQVGK